MIIKPYLKPEVDYFAVSGLIVYELFPI